MGFDKATVSFKIAVVFPLVAAILDFLAIRSIGKDEALIRSLTGSGNESHDFCGRTGNRLGPVTSQVPKALVQAGGKTLLQHVIEKLILAGVNEMVINVHHFPDQIRAFLEQHNNFGITLHISDESQALLDTGGGLLKAATLLWGEEPVLVHNVDILSNLDLVDLVRVHRERKSLATLAVRDRETQRYLLFDDDLRLTGWKNTSTGEFRRILAQAVLKFRWPSAGSR